VYVNISVTILGVCVGSWWGNRRERWPLGRPRRRWVDNIRTDLHEMGCGYMDWVGLAQDRDRWRTLVSAVMNLRVLWNAGNFLTRCKPVSFSRRTLQHGVSNPLYRSKALTLRAWVEVSYLRAKLPEKAYIPSKQVYVTFHLSPFERSSVYNKS